MNPKNQARLCAALKAAAIRVTREAGMELGSRGVETKVVDEGDHWRIWVCLDKPLTGAKKEAKP